MSEEEKTRSDHSEYIACPWCGESIMDLWDYDWGSTEGQEVACDNCGELVWLHRSIAVRYEASRVAPKPSP